MVPVRDHPMAVYSGKLELRNVILNWKLTLTRIPMNPIH